MNKERYWAVQIGKAPKNFPYLLVESEGNPEAPMLRNSRAGVESKCTGFPERKPVRVTISWR